MKKILLFLPLFIFANEAVPMPPMPPMMNLGATKKETPKKEESKKSAKKTSFKMPKECQTIPPMIILLPPPLEQSLTECKNRLYLPKLDYAKKVFAKKGLKVKSVNFVKGFVELYEVKTDKGVFYCNRNLSKCFEVKK